MVNKERIDKLKKISLNLREITLNGRQLCDFEPLATSNDTQEIPSVYHKLKWKRVLGFQIRNPIQRLRFEMTVKAIRQGKDNLLLLPVTGMTNPGDFDRYKRARFYRAVPRRYSLDSFELYLLLKIRVALQNRYPRKSRIFLFQGLIFVSESDQNEKYQS